MVIFKRKEGSNKRNDCNGKNFLPVKSKYHREYVPRLVNGYGKCNGAYEPQSEIPEKPAHEPLERVLPEGDFICHL